MSPDNEQKLTRQQRRAIEREAEKLRKREGQTRAVRKANLEVDSQVIIRDAQAQGIKPSRNEQQLWDPHERYYPDMPTPPDYEDKVVEKINLTLELMKQSENPHLLEAERYISGLSDDGDIFVRVVPELVIPDTDGISGGMGIQAGIHEDKLVCFLIVPSESLRKTPFMLALELVHESVHVESVFGRYEQDRQTKTLEEFIADEDEYSRSKALFAEESHAYARYSEALTYQFGLGKFFAFNQFTQTTAAYIRYGKNPESPQWQGFLQQRTLDYL